MTDSCVISDPYREQIRVQRKADGLLIRTSNLWLRLSRTEADRLAAFIRNEPVIQRYPVPATESPHGDEITSPL